MVFESPAFFGNPRHAIGIAITMTLVALGGCGHPIAKSLNDAKREGSALTGLHIVYQERSAAWGGRRIEIDGEGKVALYVYRPGFSSDENETLLESSPNDGELVSVGRVEKARVIEVVEMLLALEAWQQTAHDDESRLDRAKARLRLQVGGNESEIWELAEDLEANGRLLLVRRKLESLARDALPEGEAPTSEGSNEDGATSDSAAPEPTADSVSGAGQADHGEGSEPQDGSRPTNDRAASSAAASGRR